LVPTSRADHQPAAKAQPGGVLFCRIKGAEHSQRTADGFVVFRASTAVLDQRHLPTTILTS